LLFPASRPLPPPSRLPSFHSSPAIAPIRPPVAPLRRQGSVAVFPFFRAASRRLLVYGCFTLGWPSLTTAVDDINSAAHMQHMWSTFFFGGFLQWTFGENQTNRRLILSKVSQGTFSVENYCKVGAITRPDEKSTR
jgi:hypothetical protein